MRFQLWILVRLLSHKELNFYIKNKLKGGNRSKNIDTVRNDNNLSERREARFVLLIFDLFNVPGFGSSFPIRIRIQDSHINGDRGSTTLLVT
jgi:hypothetical protein